MKTSASSILPGRWKTLDITAEVYHFWHKRWYEILSAEHRQAMLGAGLAGASFTERVPDAQAYR